MTLLHASIMINLVILLSIWSEKSALLHVAFIGESRHRAHCSSCRGMATKTATPPSDAIAVAPLIEIKVSVLIWSRDQGRFLQRHVAHDTVAC